MIKPPQPTPYRISTITAVGCVSTSVDLSRFFAEVPIADGAPGITYVESRNVWRGVRPVTAIASANRRLARQKNAAMLAEAMLMALPRRCRHQQEQESPPVENRHFDNQVTVLLRLDEATMNVKVFRNGKVQLTGVRRIEQGEQAVRHLVAVLEAMERGAPGVVGDPAALEASGYRVCLINSDFHLGFEIKSDLFFACMRGNYGTACSYDPCIYPGVKIQYMWNAFHASSPSRRHGTCDCVGPCKGRGVGDVDGMCRKITIAVFQSGSVIITGAHTTAQIDTAYRFLVDDVVANHFDAIRKQQRVAVVM